MSRKREPDDSRSTYSTRHSTAPFRIILRAAAALLLLALSVDVTVGGDVGRLTVVNKTSHYVNVIVDGDPFLYISPGGGAIFEKEGYSIVTAKVFYSTGAERIGKRRTDILDRPVRTGIERL